MRVRWSACAIFACTLSMFGCQDEGTVVVHSLKFNGVHSVDEGRLKGALATKTSSRIPWGKKTFFDRTRFDADLKRVQAFYADRGFPDARVTAFDVKLNDKQDRVDLTVTISEGKPVVVTAVAFSGFDGIPPEHLADLQSKAPLKVGQPRDRQVVVATHDMAVNELKDHGFPYAKVSTGEDDGGDGRQASMTFTAEPGKLAHFGTVEVAGNTSVGDNVIERELTFKPGELFDRSKVQNSQRRLYGLELFQFANVETQDTDQQPEDVPIRVTVAEGNHQRVNFGVGYGTEEKARVDAEYHHVNFLGGARSAGVHVRWSSLDRGVRVDFVQPYFIAPHFSLGLDGQQWYTFTPAYNSITTGGKVNFTHRENPNTSWTVSLTNEHDSSTISDTVLNDPTLRSSLIALGLNPDTGEQNGTISSVGIDFQHSTADSLLNAHHGYQLSLHFEDAGTILGGSFNFVNASGDVRQYLPINDNVVLASRLQFGNLRPAGDDEANIPFAKRYFLGGATSVRGWGRFEISPLTESGLPIGGDSLLAFSEELRAALHGNLGAVFFLDVGNVWAKSWAFDLTDLRYAIGPGLRYQTPVGPLRLDFGYQLNPIPNLQVNGEPQTRRWRIHFSIGQAY
ncbi:MAG TPA: outer membrane protein assembly factor BamA [Vicinamibacterales bacterium]